MATLRQNQFTPFSNIVFSYGTASVAAGSPIDALAGNDKITGIATDKTTPLSPGNIFGVDIQDRLSLSSGNDSLTGLAYTAAGQTRVYGIVLGFNDVATTLDSGSVHDKICGHAQSDSASRFVIGIALFDHSQILTGTGNDVIEGKASGTSDDQMYGIWLEGGSVIDTGSGNDRVIGTASNTELAGPSSGIFGDETSLLLTGDGHDQVIGSATVAGNRFVGILGGLTIDLGPGNDMLKGFGSFQACGGSGKDTYNLLGYKTTDFEIKKDGQGGVTFTGSFPIEPGFTPTATLSSFEVFLFDNGVFTYNTLA